MFRLVHFCLVSFRSVLFISVLLVLQMQFVFVILPFFRYVDSKIICIRSRISCCVRFAPSLLSFIVIFDFSVPFIHIGRAR